MTYFNSCAVIFLEVNEPNKAPDLRYITVGSSDINKNDKEFENSAIAYFKEGGNFPLGTTFVLKGVQRFENQETYILFLQNQIADYIDSLT
ncbi:MAG: hypothetical protein IR153_02710 [Flavobacterium sp.]|nr:hypothetical protein [Flavobacterium sp.]